MSWLASPKVRLALIVNGIYFISFFTPTAPPPRPRLFARTNEQRSTKRLTAKAPPTYAPFPLKSEPVQATSSYSKEHDQLDVYLTDNLTLVRRLGHTLLLTPTFTARLPRHQRPSSFLMRFVAYSQEQVFDRDSAFVLMADGVEIWRSGTKAGAFHTAAYEGDQVFETFDQEVPYDIFLTLVSAQRAIITLGNDRVELSADQIEALRDMHSAYHDPSRWSN